RLSKGASVHVCWNNPWVTRRQSSRHGRFRQAAYNVTTARNSLAQLVRDAGAQVLVSGSLVTWAGALAARRARVAHVWYLQEFGLEDHGMPFQFGRRVSFAFMKRNADIFMVNSDTLQAYFSTWLPPTRFRRVHYAIEMPE